MYVWKYFKNEENNINKGIIQKNMNKKIIISGAVILFLFFLFAGYQLYVLDSVYSKNVKIEQLGINKNMELTVTGTGELTNPSMIPVTIRQIDYAGYIKEEQVFNGTIPETRIPAHSTIQFSFTATSSWVPDEETVVEVLAGKEVILVTKTQAKVAYLSIFTLSSQEEKETNITSKLKPFVQEQINAVSEKIAEYLSN